MSDNVMGMSAVKLGLAVAWPAFWMGVPFKGVFGLLFLSMGMHPWEGAGLAFLLLLSIPIDIWALGVASRTVFLERLRIEPPPSIGLTLWWQAALLSAVYLPLLVSVERWTVHTSKHIVSEGESFNIMMLFEALPIAEKIGVELVLWTSMAMVMLITLIIGWLFLFGLIVRMQATGSSAASDSYQALIRRWDLLRVPADQTLMLTVFTLAGVLLVVSFWGFLPVTTPHPHEDYEVPVKKVKQLKPAEALEKIEGQMMQAEVAVEDLEKKKPKGKKK